MIRISITLEEELANDLTAYCRSKGYTNRSEALRDMIRERLIREKERSGKGKMVGTLTVIYDHYKRELVEKLMDKGHQHHNLVLSTMHIHLDHRTYMKITALKNSVSAIKRYTNSILTTKGVKHNELMITAPIGLGKKTADNRRA